MFARFAFVSTLAVIFATPGFAAGPSESSDTPAVVAPQPTQDTPRLMFTLRGGVGASPTYFGSDELEVGPDLKFKFKYLSLGNGRSLGNPDPWADRLGLSLRGSVRFVKERTADDFGELAGLDDIDPALELGGRVRYGTEHFAAFGELRRGFGGHEGWVGELAADAILRPSDRLRLSVGPRLFLGDDEYSATYFGITPSEASAALPAYSADGGLISTGIEFGARYQINDVWGLEGAVTWEKITGDAADSPIVEQGDDEQWGIRFGVIRVFSIGG